VEGVEAAIGRWSGAIFLVVVAGNVVLFATTLLLRLDVRPRSPWLTAQLDLVHDGTLAELYSAALFALVSAAAVLNARHAVGPARRLAWIGAAAAFLWIAAEEKFAIHERFIIPGRDLLRDLGLSDADAAAYGGWLVFYAPILLLGGLVLAWFLFRALLGRPRALALAAIACWLAVLGLEQSEAFLIYRKGGAGVGPALEEGLELLGATLFLVAFRTAGPAAARGSIAPPSGSSGGRPAAGE
jgi:hypothetical protein